MSSEDSQFEVVPLTPEKVLEIVEQAYPNPVNPEDLGRDYGWSEEEVLKVLIALKHRGLIKSMEFNSFTRIHHEDKEIKVVKQMPTIASNKQPTIAIVTAQYCEKLAVDAMLENKETFVRYTTVGKYFLNVFFVKCLLWSYDMKNVKKIVTKSMKYGKFMRFPMKILFPFL